MHVENKYHGYQYDYKIRFYKPLGSEVCQCQSSKKIISFCDNNIPEVHKRFSAITI